MDKSALGEIMKYLSWSEVYAVLVSLFGVLMGRILFWTQRQKRWPTWIELVMEPIIITTVGLIGAGALALFDVDSNLAYAGVGALSGHYGPKGIDFILKGIAAKLGYKDIDICPVDDVIPPKDKK